MQCIFRLKEFFDVLFRWSFSWSGARERETFSSVEWSSTSYRQCMFLRFHRDFPDNHLDDHRRWIEEQCIVHSVDIEMVLTDQYNLEAKNLFVSVCSHITFLDGGKSHSRQDRLRLRHKIDSPNERTKQFPSTWTLISKIPPRRSREKSNDKNSTHLWIDELGGEPRRAMRNVHLLHGRQVYFPAIFWTVRFDYDEDQLTNSLESRYQMFWHIQ